MDREHGFKGACLVWWGSWRPKMRRILLLTALTGCVSQPTEDSTGYEESFDGDPSLVAFVDNPVAPRPGDSPDVLILAISGHQLHGKGDYHSETLRASGLLDSIADVFRSRGRTVETHAFTDEFFSWEKWVGQTVAVGFIELGEWTEYVNETWIQGFDNPTRVVVVAHGHGVVWSHLLTHMVDIPVDFLIDLDGDSHCWELRSECGEDGDEWGTLIREWSEYHDIQWPFDISRAQNVFTIPGRDERSDVEDVVADSVMFNLEYHAASSEGALRVDTERNVRPGGGRSGLFTNVSLEEKASIYQPWSDAVQAVRATLEQTYFPADEE